MCDTIVAVGSATTDGAVILAKNSDRDPNEAQALLSIPAAQHPAGSTVRCTYVEVPQVRQTHAVLLARPYWIWGAEMGANEHGVAIGNEAVFTRVPHARKPALTGMDMLRLALERATTARAALDVITQLLQQHGQGGNCSAERQFYYHNSFIIADPQQAWVLETAGEHWAAERVRSVRSISNALTIGRRWELASPALVDHAMEHRWCRNRAEFDFSRCYSDRLYTHFSAARRRHARTTARLSETSGRIDVAAMLDILRDHGPRGQDGRWSPARGLLGATVCMHAGFGPVRSGQSVGSMVSHLTARQQTHWLTGTAAPCTGLFWPVWIDAGLPEHGPSPGSGYDAASLWWRHETLHRSMLRDFSAALERIVPERDALQLQLIRGACTISTAGRAEQAAYSRRCLAEVDAARARWLAVLRGQPPRRGTTLHALAWRRWSRRARCPE